MTVSSSISSVSYSGNGATTGFSYTFKIFANSDLVVSLKNNTTGVSTTQTLTTDYTVSGAGSDSGGTVTFVTAPPSGNTVIIRRVLPYTQETDYTENDPFPAASHEDALDKLTMLTQQNRDEDAIKLPDGDVTSGINNVVPNVVDRANTLLGFDATGNVIVEPFTSSSLTTSITQQALTGDGSTTAFTLASNPGAAGVGVSIYIDGVYQERDTYSISDTTLTFTEAPPTNSSIEVLNYRITDIGTADANNVTYSPNGSGAVQTTVQAKLRESVSVKDFGAVVDDSTDNTAAVQSAIDSIGSYGGTVYINEGCNFYSQSLTLPQRINLDYRVDDDKSSVGQLSDLASGERVLFSSNSSYPTQATGGAVNERRLSAPLHPGYVVDVRKDLSSAATYFGPGQALTPARASYNILDEQSEKFTVLYVNYETYDQFSGVYLQARRQNVVLTGIGSGDWASLPAVNELITGATSGAKGHFVSADASSTTINWYSGTFVAGEALTDSNETTTAIISSISASTEEFNPLSQDLTNGAWSVGLPPGAPTHTWAVGGKSAVTKSRTFGQDQIETVTNPSRVWIDNYEATTPNGFEIVYDVTPAAANRRLTTRSLDSSSDRGMVGAVSATTGFNNSALKATSSYNVASVTRDSIGQYTITFDTPMARADYQVSLTTSDPLDYATIYIKTTTTLSIRVQTTGTTTLRDLTWYMDVICTCGDI